MKKRQYILLLTPLLLLTSCNKENNEDKKVTSELISKLKSGYEVKGSIVEYKTYYNNDEYDTATHIEEVEYKFDYVYTNSNGFTGVDRSLKKYEGDYVFTLTNDNSSAREGYVDLNWLDYDNTVILNDPAYIDDGASLSKVPYGSNGLINPFTYIFSNDFEQISSTQFELSHIKSSLMIQEMFSLIGNAKVNAPILSSIATFDDNMSLTNINILTDSVKLKEVDPEDKTLVLNYTSKLDISLDYSKIADTNSIDLIQPIEDKGNSELQTALNNMAEIENFTMKRVADYTVMGEDWQETILSLYSDLTLEDGTKTRAILEKVYNLRDEEDFINSATTNDALLLENYGANKNVYTFGYNQATKKYDISGVLGKIDGLYPYQLYLPNYRGVGENKNIMSANIFTYNEEDGFYYMHEDLVPYALVETMLPFFMNSEENFGGYGDTIKIKLTEDKQYIEYIEARCLKEVGTEVFDGTYKLYLSDFNTTVLPEYVKQ